MLNLPSKFEHGSHCIKPVVNLLGEFLPAHDLQNLALPALLEAITKFSGKETKLESQSVQTTEVESEENKEIETVLLKQGRSGLTKPL